MLSSPDDPQFEQQPGVGVEPPAALDAEFPLSPVETLLVASPKPRDPVWSGLDVLLIAVLTIVTIIVAEFVTVCVAWVFFHRHSDFRALLQTPSLDLLGEILGYIAVALYMIMLVEGKYQTPFWQAIRWNWSGKAVPKLLLLGVLTVSLDLLGRYLPMPKTSPFEQFFANPRDAYLMAAFAVTFGPLMEELFFRGFLYPVLERRTGVTLAVRAHRTSVWSYALPAIPVLGSGVGDHRCGRRPDHGAGGDQIGSCKFCGACRIQRDVDVPRSCGDGRLPAHG